MDPVPTPQPQHKFPIFLSLLVVLLLLSTGYLSYQNMQLKKQIAELSKPTPTLSSAEASVKEGTVNWETYTNATHHILFKYPSSWVLKTIDENQETNSEIFLSKDENIIHMYLALDGIGGNGKDVIGTPYEIDNISLYKFTDRFERSQFFTTPILVVGLTDQLTHSLGVFHRQNKIYSIQLWYSEKLKNTPEEKIILSDFDQILSTFKFLPED